MIQPGMAQSADQGVDLEGQIKEGVMAFIQSQDPAIAVEVVNMLAESMGIAPELDPYSQDQSLQAPQPQQVPAGANGMRLRMFRKGGKMKPKMYQDGGKNGKDKPAETQPSVLMTAPTLPQTFEGVVPGQLDVNGRPILTNSENGISLTHEQLGIQRRMSRERAMGVIPDAPLLGMNNIRGDVPLAPLGPIGEPVLKKFPSQRNLPRRIHGRKITYR